MGPAFAIPAVGQELLVSRFGSAINAQFPVQASLHVQSGSAAGCARLAVGVGLVTVFMKAILATVMIGLFPAAAWGWDSSDLNKFRGTLRCIDCDLRNANLAGADLRASNLSGSDLSDASLYYSSLIGADLSGAILQGADLRGANLFYALLSQVRLTGTDLSGANLTGADLAGADLSRADLSGANLFAASLIGATLSGTDFGHASLHRANLSGAVINGSPMDTAILCETLMPDGRRDDRDC